MENDARPSAVLEGAADPLTKARVLAALLGGPLSWDDLARRVTGDGVADALDELLAGGSVRRTAGGGLALQDGRRAAALDALARDLRVGARPRHVELSTA